MQVFLHILGIAKHKRCLFCLCSGMFTTDQVKKVLCPDESSVRWGKCKSIFLTIVETEIHPKG